MAAVYGWDPTPVLSRMDGSSTEVAVRLGVSGATVRMWRNGRRRISTGNADRIALDLGLHPSNLWPTWPTQPAETA